MMNWRSVTSSVRPEGGAQRDWQREPGGLGPSCRAFGLGSVFVLGRSWGGLTGGMGQGVGT